MPSFIRTYAVAAGMFIAGVAFAQTPAPTAKPAAQPAPAAVVSQSAAAPAAMPAAAGGGAGKVWLNTKSNVYHCEGSKHYGKTKEGTYLPEAEAKAKGAHADHGKACTK
jgi:hypothetical protein